MNGSPTHHGFVERAQSGEYAGRLFRACKTCQMMTNYHVNKQDMFREWRRLTKEHPTCNGFKMRAANDDNTPTPEQQKRIGSNFDYPNNPESSAQTMRVYAEDHLEQFRKDGRISEAQFQAGDKLRLHHYHASLTGERRNHELKEAVDQSFSPAGMNLSEMVMHHRQAYNKAIRVVPRCLMPFIHSMVLELTHSNLVEMGKGHFNRKGDSTARSAALASLETALECLVDHFGVTASDGHGRVHGFGDRPTIIVASAPQSDVHE